MTSLQDLISWLERLPPGMEVVYSDGGIPGAFLSWCGNYNDLTLTRDGRIIPCANLLLKHARDCIGKTFDGYKGGEYRMDAGTPLHADDWGEYTGDESEILGGKVRDGQAIIIRRGLNSEGWTT